MSLRGAKATWQSRLDMYGGICHAIARNDVILYHSIYTSCFAAIKSAFNSVASLGSIRPLNIKRN